MLMSQREAIVQMAGEVLTLADGSQLSDAEVGVLVTFLWIARIRCGSYKRNRRAGAPRPPGSGSPSLDAPRPSWFARFRALAMHDFI